MTSGVAMIATVKDEGPWLLEWIAHNLVLGFDAIVVASNDCTDGTDAMLDRLDAMGLITHDPNYGLYGGYNVQFAAYQRMRRLPAVANAEGVLALDADEFLNIKSGAGRLEDWLPTLPPEPDVIQIGWRYYGDSGTYGWIEGEVCDALTWAEAPGRATRVKSLLRDHHRILHFGVHAPRLDERNPAHLQPRFTISDAIGRPVPAEAQDAQWSFIDRPPEFNCWDRIQINHYMLKNRELFLLKRLRGSAGGAEMTEIRMKLADRMEKNLNEVEDRSIERTAPARKAMLAHLMADPVLADLHTSACDVARARMADLVAELDG